MFTCQVCQSKFEAIRQFSKHVGSHMEKQEYYDKFIGEPGKCKCCNSSTKFLSLSKGYSPYCSRSCQVKLAWVGDVKRKEKYSKRMTLENIGVPGSRKGKKNKTPYPKTDAVKKRLEDLFTHLRRIDHWHNMNLKVWEQRSDDVIAQIIKKRDMTRITNILADLNSPDFSLSEKSYQSLCEVFDVYG